MKYLIFIILCTIASHSASIKGKVIDSQTNIPIIGASIRIDGTGLGDYTNKYGEFEINNIKTPSFRIIISSIGYKTIIKEVNLTEMSYVEISLEEQSLQTGEIVVSANKRIQAVQEVPISMSLISNESIINRGITRLDDALEYVPGVEVNQDNVSIRGSSGFAFGIGSRVALLVDGFPLLAGDNGDMKFDALPMYNTNQIEIVKGAGSALYGTSALGGVVNLITKEPTEDIDLRARAYTGVYTKPRYDTWQYSDELHMANGLDIAYNQKFNNLGVSFSGGIREDESYRVYDNQFRWNIFTKFGYNINDRNKVEINFNATEEISDDWVYWNSLDSATVPPTDTDRSIQIESIKYSIFGKYDLIFNQNFFLNYKVGIFYTKFNNSFEQIHPEYRQSGAVSFNTELQFNSKFTSSFLMTYGLNLMNNNVSSKTYGNRNQQIYAAYTQAEYSGIDLLTLTLGSRIDYEKTEDTENSPVISPKFGLAYKLNENMNLRASAGAGFRAASVAERYSSVSFQGFEVIPNESLQAEKSFSFEIGFNWDTKLFKSPLIIDFAFFNNEMYDLIEPQFLADQGAVIRFDNVTRARVTGAEMGIKTLLFGNVGFETSITAMNPRDLDLNETLKYRSEFLWYNSIYIPLGAFEFSADYRYKSQFDNIDVRLGLQVTDYEARVPMHVVDARLIWDLNKSFQIPIKASIIGNNIFDYYYTEMVGNLALTRRLTFQLETIF